MALEAIGGVAGIITLADNTFNLLKTLRNIRDGGEQRLRLFKEVTSLSVVLDKLQAVIENEGHDFNTAALAYGGTADLVLRVPP